MTVTLNDAAIEAAAGGAGIPRVLFYQVAHRIETGELKLLLERYEPAHHPVHIVHQHGRNLPAKVRTLIDLAVMSLRSNPRLNG